MASLLDAVKNDVSEFATPSFTLTLQAPTRRTFSMSVTSFSLLERLRQDPDESAWERLVDLYTPLIRVWLRRYALLDQDADDLVQEVLTIVVRKIPEFKKNAQVGSFRRWLRSITVNCLRGFWRSQRYRPKAAGIGDFAAVLDQLEDPHSALSRLWDEEHDAHVARRLLARIRPHFEAKTWLAFQRVAIEGVPVDLVAKELGITVNAVFIAKSRVVHLLKQEGKGLLE
jgi:RNA polymerase sigma-70 factor (ECF subfamily)